VVADKTRVTKIVLTMSLCFAEIGLAHARLAGIPTTRVINTWTTKKFEQWLRR
jgi:hypothetical protein